MTSNMFITKERLEHLKQSVMIKKVKAERKKVFRRNLSAKSSAIDFRNLGRAHDGAKSRKSSASYDSEPDMAALKKKFLAWEHDREAVESVKRETFFRKKLHQHRVQ